MTLELCVRTPYVVGVPEAEEICRTDVHACGAFGPVLISFWRATPTIESIRPRQDWLRQAATADSPMGYLIVVEECASFSRLPSPAYAAYARKQIKLIHSQTAFAALVVEGDSVLRMLARTFLRGQQRFAGKAHHTRSFYTAEGACDWISQQLAPWKGPSGEALFGAAEAFRNEKRE